LLSPALETDTVPDLLQLPAVGIRRGLIAVLDGVRLPPVLLVLQPSAKLLCASGPDAAHGRLIPTL